MALVEDPALDLSPALDADRAPGPGAGVRPSGDASARATARDAAHPPGSEGAVDAPSAGETGVRAGEAAARRALRAQIARLERRLAEAFASSFPRATVDVGVAAPAGGGPRMLTLGELERQRDALQARLREAGAALEARAAEVERNRVLLERMLQEPRRHKFARIRCADLDLGGCGAYEVRPRLGLLGMLMGWWEVKLSSGCPLARPSAGGTPCDSGCA